MVRNRTPENVCGGGWCPPSLNYSAPTLSRTKASLRHIKQNPILNALHAAIGVLLIMRIM